MKTLLISGNTLEEWDVNDVIGRMDTRSEMLERIIQYELDNKVGPYCEGFTYYQLEQMDRI